MEMHALTWHQMLLTILGEADQVLTNGIEMSLSTGVPQKFSLNFQQEIRHSLILVDQDQSQHLQTIPKLLQRVQQILMTKWQDSLYEALHHMKKSNQTFLH